MKMAESSSNREKITVGKGEIAHYEQFLLFPHSVFKKLVLQTLKNQGLFGKRLIALFLHNVRNFDPKKT